MPLSTLHKFVLKETYEPMLVILFGIFILRERRWGELVGESCRTGADQPRADRSSSARIEATSVVASYSSNSSRPTTAQTPCTWHHSSALNVVLSSRRKAITAATAVSDLAIRVVQLRCARAGQLEELADRLNAIPSQTSALDAGSDAVACTSVECGTRSNGVERLT